MRRARPCDPLQDFRECGWRRRPYQEQRIHPVQGGLQSLGRGQVALHQLDLRGQASGSRLARHGANRQPLVAQVGDNLAADVASGTNNQDWGHRNYPTVPGDAVRLNNGSRRPEHFHRFPCLAKNASPFCLWKSPFGGHFGTSPKRGRRRPFRPGKVHDTPARARVSRWFQGVDPPGWVASSWACRWSSIR